MPIRKRYLSKQDTQLVQTFSLPSKLFPLFNSVLPMGTILSRQKLFREELPKYDANKISIEGTYYSIRPAWTSYHGSPLTHVYIIGHILICHIIKDTVFYYQPSVRLFGEDAKSRTRNFEMLVQRACHYKDWQPAVPAHKAIVEWY